MVSRNFAFLALTTGLLLVVSATASAQYAIELKDGSSVKGWITDDDGSRIQVSLDTGGQGSATTSYLYDELGPRTIFRLMQSRTKPEDAKGELKLASYALDHGMYMEARMHYLSAQKADEQQGGLLADELASLKHRAAGVVLERGKEQIAAGRSLEAEKNLALILKYLPTAPEAEEARKLIDQISQKAMAEREQERERLARTESDKVRKKLQGLRKNYDRAHELIRDGLKIANRPQQSIGRFEAAVAEFDKCLKALRKADQEVQGDEEFTKDVRAWIETVGNDRVEARLDIASAYFTRQTLTKALEVVNGILAEDPKNAAALEMRGRIEVASNENPWGRRRRVR